MSISAALQAQLDRQSAWPQDWPQLVPRDLERAGEFLRTIGGRHQFLLLPDNAKDREDGARPIVVRETSWKDAAVKLVEANIGVYRPEVGRVVRYGVYWTLCETTDGVRRKGKMGAARVVFADFDHKDEQFAPDKYPLEPLAEVFSGNGTHVYWRVLDCTAEQMANINGDIAAKLRSDPAVAKETQIARVPGLLNNKAEKPKKGYFYSFAPDSPRRSVEELADAFGTRGPRSSRASIYINDDAPVSAAAVEAITVEDRVRWCAERLASVPETRGNDFWRVCAIGHDFAVPQSRFFELIKPWAAQKLLHRRSRTRFDEAEIAQYVREGYAHATRPYGCEAVKRAETQALVQALCGSPTAGLNKDGCAVSETVAANSTLNTPTTVDATTVAKPRPQPKVAGIPLKQPIKAKDLEPGSVTRIELTPDCFVSDNMTAAVDYDDAEGVVTFLKAPMGKGKTHWAADQAAAFKTVVAIAPNVSLVQSLGSRYNSEIYSEDGAKGADRVATTLKSLPKIDADPRNTFQDTQVARQFVALDEIDQLNGFHFSGLLDSPSLTKQHLVWSVCAAAQSVVTSADLTDEQIALFIDIFREMRPDLRFVVATQAPGAKPDRLVRLLTAAACQSELFKAIDAWKPGDLPLALCSTSAALPEELARAIRLRRKKVRTAWISSRNSQRPAVQAALRTPDDIVKDCDIILISPSVQSGVSFDRPVQRVYVLQTYKGVLGTTVCQMAMRFRNVADPQIVWGMTNWQATASLPTDEFTLRRLSLGFAAKTDEIVAEAAVEYDLAFDRSRRPKDPGLQRMWVVHKSAQNAMLNDPVGETVAAMHRHGWHVTDERWREADEARRAAWKQVRDIAKKNADDDYCRSILEAECLTLDEAEKIEGQSSRTEEEAAALEKTRMRDFYGRAPDDALVERDDRGKWRRRVRLYNDALAYTTQARRFLTWRETKDVHGKTAAEYKHRLLKAKLMSQLYVAVTVRGPGDALDGIQGGASLSMTATEARRVALQFYGEHEEDFRFLYRSTLNDPDKAVTWLNAQLRRMGAQIDSDRAGSGDERTYHYDFAQAHADGEYDRQAALATARHLVEGHTMVV